jgi:hypothetical protein
MKNVKHRKRAAVSLILALFMILGVSPASVAAGSDTLLPPSDLKANLLREAYGIPSDAGINLSWIFRETGFDKKQTAYELQIGAAPDGSFDIYAPGWVTTADTIAEIPAGTLSENSLYYWRVRAKNGGGDISDWSETACLTTAIGDSGWTSTQGIWLGAASDTVPDWTDYTVEQDITITGNAANNGALAVMFRATDSTHWYAWQFLLSTHTSANGLSALYCNGGPAAALGMNVTKTELAAKGVTFEINKKFRAKISVTGSGPVYVKTWVDMDPDNGPDHYILIGEHTISGSNIFPSGSIGYRTGQSEKGVVSNIRVTSLVPGHEGEVLLFDDYSDGLNHYGSSTTVSGGAVNVNNAAVAYYKIINSEKGDFIFLRRQFSLPQTAGIQKAILSASAYGTQNSLSYVYDLFFNGRSIGVGPARDNCNSSGGSIARHYNNYDVTDMLLEGGNLIAASCYSRLSKAVLFQLTVFYKNGTKAVLTNSGADSSQWRVKDGTSSFGEGSNMGTGYYAQAGENMNGVNYPYGWNQLSFSEDSSWRAPALKSMGISATCPLIPNPAENNLRFDMPAAGVKTVSEGNYIIDIGKVIVGGLMLKINNPNTAPVNITVGYGEELRADGSVMYNMRTGNNQLETWTLKPGLNVLPTTLMKTFRWVQITGSPVPITADMATGLAVRQAFNTDPDFASDNTYSLTSDNDLMNDLSDLFQYSIMSNNQDLYTDSQSRERGAYEGDLIIHGWQSFAYSDNYALNRHSAEYLIDYPTWCPEYALNNIEMCWADYLYTGDKASLEKEYTKLKGKLPNGKTAYNPTFALCRENETVQTNGTCIDWPASEQDGYCRSGATNASAALSTTEGSFTTAYNAMAYGAYRDMASIAAVLGFTADAGNYQNTADAIKQSLITKLYDPTDGGFFDSISGAGRSTHKAQHATGYALSYGIWTDQDMANKMAGFIRAQGRIRTGVSGAFFLIRGLYKAGAGDLASQLMLKNNPSDYRTWAHMLYGLNATMACEAWDPSFKPNMTFSHPWGGTPGSQITQGVFGIMPLKPGFDLFQIKFQPGDSSNNASIQTPTVKGPVRASFSRLPFFLAHVEIPANSRALVSIPAERAGRVAVNGVVRDAEFDGVFLTVELGSGVYDLIAEDDIPEPALRVSVSVGQNGAVALDTPFKPIVTAINEYNRPVDLSGADISLSFDDPAIVAAGDGFYTAAKAVTSTLTATVTLGGLTGTATALVMTIDENEPEFTITARVESNGLLPGVGMKARLIVTPAPAPSQPSLTVVSSNPSIATYNADGTLNLLKVGTTNLTITMASRGRFATTAVSLTVAPAPIIPEGSFDDVFIQLGNDPDTDSMLITDAPAVASLRYKTVGGDTGAIAGAVITSKDAEVSVSGNQVTPVSVGGATLLNNSADLFAGLSPVFDFNRIVIPSPLHTDDFSAANRTFTAGSVSNGRFFSGGSGSTFYSGGTAWTDYAYSVKAQVNVNCINLTFRHTSPSSFYLWQFNAQQGLLRKHVFKPGLAGGYYLLSETPLYNFSNSGVNDIMVAVEGFQIMSYVNGWLIDTYTVTDEAYQLPNGSVGYRNGGSESFYMDNLAVGPRTLITSRGITVENPEFLFSYNGSPATSVEKGQMLNVKAHFNAGATTDQTMIAALYSKEGRLLSLTTAGGVSDEKGIGFNADLKITDDVEDGAYVKVFVWDAQTWAPLRKPADFPAK